MSILALPSYVQKLPKKARIPLQTCVYGLGAGVVTVGFQVGMSRLYDATFVNLSHQSTSIFLIGTFLVLMSTSLMVGWLLSSFCREASGSGIPQLKVAFWRDFGFVPWRVVWVKFIAGILSIGGGSSLGREGPSVQLAGGLGSKLGGILGEAKQNRRAAAASGAAAGLAAAFNTPLASVTFVLEEIIQDLNSRMLGGVLLAAVIGALVVHGLLGPQPAFTLGNVESPSWLVYVITPFVAAFAGLSGMVFQKTTLGLRAKRKHFRHVPAWILPSFGALITWCLGIAVFLTTHRLGVFSLGYADLSDALGGHLAWQLAGLLLITKLIATFSCYGFGGCGGVFSPTLFFGAMSGVFVAGLCNLIVPLTTSDVVALAVVGMSACLGAVVRAPVTGILIVFEMTHEFSLVPLLMLGSLVSQAVSYKLSKESLYDAILAQDGIHIDRIVPPRDLQSWQQLPVSTIAKFQPVVVADLEPVQLEQFLQEHPYQRFPVIQKGKLAGVLTRREAQAALVEKRSPKLEPAIFCLPARSIKDLQHLLMESHSGLVVILDQIDGNILGLVTLHDLLRAEVSTAERSGD